MYQKRKTDARIGIKLPEVRPRRAFLFEEIAADALAYSKEHKASYSGNRSTIGKPLPVFGKTPAEEMTAQTIRAYLDTRDALTKTTINRYRGTLSISFQWRFVIATLIPIPLVSVDHTMRLMAEYVLSITRSTYISRLVMAGVDLRTVQELAGHKGVN